MNKSIVITGATGFVGKRLTLKLLRKGYNVRVISRNTNHAKFALPLPVSYHQWDGHSEFPQEALEDAYGVIHLSGENIADGRWSSSRKAAIRDSRIKSTKILTDAIAKCTNPPRIMVGTSAIGIYGERGDESLTETSANGKGFLADVCAGWEKSYEGFKGRLAVLRVGVVLGYGGALDKMLLPFRLGIGGKLASGKQWMSWIHIDDLVNMYIHALESEDVSGAYNAVASTPVTNSEFTRAMGNALRRPVFLPAPKVAIQILFGEMSEVVLGSQKVLNQKILETKFTFSYPTIKLALENLLVPGGHFGSHVAEFAQWIPKPRTEVFAFFSKAENLEKITPDWISFKVTKKSSPDIKVGCLIDYRLKIKGVPASWRTLISTWEPQVRFIDEQLKGPYSLWHHTHGFEDMGEGTLITDRVIYRAPLGPIGSIVEFLMIRNDVKKIFGHRIRSVGAIFA